MEDWAQIIITALISVFGAVMGSTGFWAFMQKRAEKEAKDKEKDSASNRMLRGLGHVKIMERGLKFIERGWITKDEYEDLYVYLYNIKNPEYSSFPTAQSVIRRASFIRSQGLQGWTKSAKTQCFRGFTALKIL